MASCKELYFDHNILKNLLEATGKHRQDHGYVKHIDLSKGNDHLHNLQHNGCLKESAIHLQIMLFAICQS